MVDLSRVNRRELWILAGLIVVTLAGGWVALSLTGHDVPGVSSGPTSQETQPAVTLNEIPLRTTVAKVAGTLPKKTRNNVEHQVDVLLTRYVADAFLGDYPSKDFTDTWMAFTDGVVDSAKKDSDLLTGERWSGETVTVEPGRLVAKISLLANNKKPVGGTAQILFKLQPVTADGPAVPVTVKGRLILTRVGGEWRIFGYDVSAPAAPKQTGANQ